MMASTRKTVDWTAELLDDIEARVVAGESVASVARTLGLASSRSVLHAFRRAGRESPATLADRARQRRLDDAAWLTKRYVTESRTIRQIGAELHLGDKPVVAALRRFGIERPRPDDEIVAAFERGESIRAITRQLGVDRDVVRRVLRSNGLHDGARRMGPAAQIDPRRLRRLHVTEKMSAVALARELGVSPAAVKRALHRHSIPIIDHRIAHPLLRDREWLERRHLDEHRTQAEIASELGVSVSTVGRAFKRHSLKRPSRAVLTDRTWLWNTHRRDDVSIHRIARWLRVDPARVVEALGDHDIEPRHRPDEYTVGPDHLLDPDWLIERYAVDQASIEMIAHQTGTGTVAVRQAIRDAGIRR